MLLWILIGVVSGVTLGLTGAGGGIISVPMFIYLAGASIVESSILSLLTVAFCSIFAWFFQRRDTYFEFSIILAAFSLLSSHYIAPIKRGLPDWTILVSFICVTVFGVVMAWRKKEKAREVEFTRAHTRNFKFFLKAAGAGIVLGLVTVMTGLGGGVLMTPWMSGGFGMSLNKAVATSLFMIVISTIGAAWIQRDQIERFLSADVLVPMIFGALIAALITRKLLRGMKPEKLDLLRRVAITTVVAIAITGSLIKKFS